MATVAIQGTFFAFLAFLCSGHNLNSTDSNIIKIGDTSISCLKQSESYSFKIPTIYTIVFMSVIFLCSIFYFVKLLTNRQVYVKRGSIKSYIRTYVITGLKFKSVYGSLFTQLFDQVSDISVILQLYYLAKDENNQTTDVTCYHMNTYYLFIASLFVFLFYRFLSSFLIYRLLSNSNSPLLYKIILTLLQFFDLSFIVTLKINYQFQNMTPCNPQRYITNLEAVFEAAPQFIIQLFVIITLNVKQNNMNHNTNSTNNTYTNLILIISLFFSLMSIVSKKLSQDKEVVKLKWQNANFLWKKRAERELAELEATTAWIEEEKRKDADERDTKTLEQRLQDLQHNIYVYNRSFFCCSLNMRYYIHRIIWRIFSIMHRLILWMLTWRIIGGFWFIGCVLFEFTFYSAIYFFTAKNIFFQSVMGYVLQNVHFKKKYEEYEKLKKKEVLFLYHYILSSTTIYSTILCALFVLSQLDVFDCCIGTSLSSSSFFINLFVVFGIFCLCCTLLAMKKRRLFILFCIYRHIVFMLILFLFDCYVFACIISIDLMVLSLYTLQKQEKYPFFVRLWIQVCSPIGPYKIQYVILFFHSIIDVYYCLCLIFFAFYSSQINILFINNYNETIYYLFWNSNDTTTAMIIIVLLSFCCVLSVVLPLWTYYLLEHKRMMNSRASNERKYSKMILSGDIMGFLEMVAFNGQNYRFHTKNIDDDNITGYEKHQSTRILLQHCVESSNFRTTVFASLNFFQQYQIMKYLSTQYNVTIPFAASSEMQHVLKQHICSKEFAYQFKNNNELLVSYITDCIENGHDRTLFWQYVIDEGHVEWIFSGYLEHFSNVSLSVVPTTMERIFVTERYVSSERLGSLVNIAENKLDNSKKSEIIKNFLFQDVSQKQWNDLSQNINERIFKYWAFVFKKVMFCSFL